ADVQSNYAGHAMLGHVNGLNTGLASAVEHGLVRQLAPDLRPEEHLHLTATIVSRSDVVARADLLQTTQKPVTKLAPQNSQRLLLQTHWIVLLCATSVYSVSLWLNRYLHHRDTEYTEVAQRNQYFYTATSANRGDASCCPSPSKNWRCQISKL